jgi:predicted NBD/HSP70 family sugar kinase
MTLPTASSFNLTQSERAALELIWLKGETNRIAVSDHLAVSRMQATNIARSLIEKTLVVEVPVREGGRGQPSRALTMAADAAFTLGVKIWRTRLEVGLLASSGKIAAIEQIRLDQFTVDSVAEATRTYLETMGRSHPERLERLVGIGFSFPGYFIDARHMTQAYFSDWDGLDIAAALKPYFSTPVLVENDGACAAWGERLLGSGARFDDFLFIDINYGVGGGVVMGGRLIRGARGNAGMFGVPFPVGTVRPSGQDLMDRMRANGIAIDDLPDLDAYRLTDHPQIDAWISRAADQLRPALSVLAGAFDPQAIIVGGASSTIAQALVARIDTEAFCEATRAFLPVPTLLASGVPVGAAAAGAAALAMGRVLFPRPAA